jgi:uncharacterized coiled-coil DUF342 family protein
VSDYGESLQVEDDFELVNELLEQDLEELQQRLQDRIREYERLKERRDANVEGLQEEIDSRKKRIDDLELKGHMKADTRKQLRQLRGEIAEKQNQISNIRSRFDIRLSELEQEIHDLESEIRRQKRDAEFTHEHMDDL